MRVAFIALLLSFVFAGTDVRAADPALPEPITQLRDQGAQIKYLGRDLGFDGWIAIKDGQEQYFYVTPDGSAFFLGVLFNKNGRAITFDQMKRLQGQDDPVFKDLMNAPSQKTENADLAELAAPKNRAEAPLAEQLMQDVETGHIFTLGLSSAPTVYMFIDPLCPHCKDMLKTMKPAIDTGKVKVNIVLIGALAPQSRSLARGILDSGNPGAALTAIVQGRGASVKLGTDAPDARLERNIDILKKWKFDATPVTVYRGRDGTVKLVQGAAANAEVILNDLP